MSGKAEVRVEKVTIPTYEIGEYNKNPMFLEKRVYQGSSGRVYPHPVCESISDEKKDKEYTAVYLENDYILVMILPEIGGRIQRLYDKTNGYDAVYYNEVIKPALVGLAGPWISGGIEFNWPQHHRPSTFDPVQYTVEEHEDGSVTCTVGETEKMFHTRGTAAFTVYPDRAYLEIKGRVYNPTEEPKTFLWWANPAVSVGDTTRSIFPPDVTAVFDHGKRDVSEFPIAKGVYYKVDYAPGTDISMYKNIPVPTSYMAHKSDYNFIGNYDDAKSAGLLHVADHHISPGKKQWTWGNGDFGRAWDRNLTDENGPYIELMTGVFTDNQPDFTFLKPFEEKTFTQYFMPYKACGAIKNATEDLAVNIENKNGSAEVVLYASKCFDDRLKVTVSASNGREESSYVNLKASESVTLSFAGFDAELEGTKVKVETEGDLVLEYTVKHVEPEIPSPASPMKAPGDVESLEKLFLCGTHLEQYRHATFRPEDYYLEGLKRDSGDIRLNNAYGKLIYGKGRFEESVDYFKRAIKRMTMFNPNPYDCEAYYNLGLAYRKTGEEDKAYDAFYKATWDGNQRGRAFFELALLESGKGNFEKALEFVNESLNNGLHNSKARTLKTAMLRILGRTAEAAEFLGETLKTDPIEPGALYEKKLLFDDGSFDELMRPDNEDYRDLAILYFRAGLKEEAVNILNLSPSENEPMKYYYLYYFTGDEVFAKKAEQATTDYCFPNRIEDISVLLKAVKAGCNMAAYYLGCLYYDKGQWEQAREMWESVKDRVKIPTVHRNLSLVYYNKLGKKEDAQAEMELAFSMDRSDARIFFELDQLYKVTDKDAGFRLKNMEDNKALLETRDDLYTEYITLLNGDKQYEKAYSLIMGHKFHPWEGGEGKITGAYKQALIGLAACAPDKGKAREYIKKAFSFPENLGEGKLIGELDNDLYYLLAGYTADAAEAEKNLELATRGEDNFTSAVYYNDQPPEMMYYRALAFNRLGDKDRARRIAEGMINFGNTHMNDEVKIDYFAVSLPDFLIFDADLNKKNRRHCENMIKLGEAVKAKL